MRIPSDKPPLVEQPITRDKTATDPASRPTGSSTTRTSDAGLPSATLERAVQDAEIATREFEQTIAARLEQVGQQLLDGNYAIDYDRLAQRLAEEGFAS
jgi:anti-sigma28 factor (negative regulator of flagellin synthesis)